MSIRDSGNTAAFDELARLQALGFKEGPPPLLPASARLIDFQCCREAICGDCGGVGLTYRPHHRPATGSYVALAICQVCGWAECF